MSMTITEKILARASGRPRVEPGDMVEARVDWLMTNDATTHLSWDIFSREVEIKHAADPSKVVFIVDHNVPAERVQTAEAQNLLRRWARSMGAHLHDGEGVCHQILLERYSLPGGLVVGADSHTCTQGAVGACGVGVGSTDFVAALVTGRIWLLVPSTVRIELSGSFARGVCARDLALKIVGDLGAEGAAYKAVEFAGPSAATLPMDDRITLCNLMVEAGAKNALFGSDQVTFDYLMALNRPVSAEPLQSDEEAAYDRVMTYDLGSVAPAVAAPHAVDNYGTVADYARKKQVVNQGFIGSCSAGRMGELREAARILRGRQVKPGVRLIVTPASRTVQAEAATEGVLAALLDAGAIVMNPNCSVCWGACQGVMGPGETLISTGTRNFRGRAGSKDSSVYLASAATVAASCVAGSIVDPRELMQ